MVVPLLFIAGSIIGLLFQIIAVIIHSKDGYSVLRSQLSYTGNRQDFYHEKYDRHFKRAQNPFWFNYAYIFGGVLYLLGFLTVSDLSMKLLGSGFAVTLIFVGIWDVGSNYKYHSIAIIATQVFYLPFQVVVLVKYYSIPILIYTIILFFFIFWYLYTKVANTLNYKPNRITIAQRIGVLLESIFVILYPFIIS